MEPVHHPVYPLLVHPVNTIPPIPPPENYTAIHQAEKYEKRLRTGMYVLFALALVDFFITAVVYYENLRATAILKCVIDGVMCYVGFKGVVAVKSRLPEVL
jgi:hypothetical protein